jgi:hypothetical protein
VYPELVIRDDRGRIMGVHYEELAPMLLGEIQRERRETSVQISAQAEEIRGLREELHAAIRELQAHGRIAQE